MLRKRFAPFLVVLTILGSISFGQAPPRDPAEENPIIDELRAMADNQTAERFITATAALDGERYDEAERLYREVLLKAPEFDAALRRLGYACAALGKRDEGLELTAKALAKTRSVPNLLGRAGTLLSSNSPDFRPSKPELDEAISLSREAWQKSGNSDSDSGFLLAEALLMSQQYTEFNNLAPVLRRQFPESGQAAYYNALAIADRGDLDAAETEIETSRKLGAPDEVTLPLLNAIGAVRDEQFFGLGRFRTYVYPVVGLIAFWAIGLVALFVLGRHLSKKTLKSIEESGPDDVTGEAQSSLRKIYRWVVSIAGIYYYISQPFVIVVVIAFTASVVLFFLWIGRIPVQFVLVLSFVGAASIFYMVKSLVIRTKVEEPGRALSESEAPGLWDLVRNVAATVKTRPVTEIRITPGTDLAVYERGGFRAKMSDNAERILILGTAVLNDFDQNAFRAVLAHEYGHFSNRDTAGGDIAFRVNNDIARVAESMVASGTSTVYNLGFQFLRLFHFLFRRITHGASRLQEVLADRVAAYHFGGDAFREGLRHVIRRELEFNHVVNQEVSAALGASRAIPNLYELRVQDESAKKEIDEEFGRVFDEATSEDNTHPSPRDRFRYIAGARSAEVRPLTGEVWDLFADRDAVTSEMSQVISGLVRPDYTQSETILGI